MERKLLTADEVAEMLGFTNRLTIWRLARAHKIDTVFLGHRMKFTREAVDKFIRDNTITTEDAQQVKEALKGDNPKNPTAPPSTAT
jgi:excisionase family DNA binding protein